MSDGAVGIREIQDGFNELDFEDDQFLAPPHAVDAGVKPRAGRYDRGLAGLCQKLGRCRTADDAAAVFGLNAKVAFARGLEHRVRKLPA
jgi:hypothetical protein